MGNAFARPAFNRSITGASSARAQAGIRLRDGAWQGMLETPPAAIEDERGAGRLQLKFHKRGNAFRDFNKSYRDMCNNVSSKIWDEPNGKRVRFDVAGKPGVGVEIPIH